jgi:hypothetical protein
MSTAILTLPRRRFSDSDLLLILIWGAMLTLSVAMPNLHGLLPILGAGGVLILRSAIGEPDSSGLVLAVLMPVFGVASGFAFNAVTKLTPLTYDVQLARLDMGVAPWVRSFALSQGWIMALLVTAYKALPETILIAVAFTAARTRRKLIGAMYLGSFLCLVWYLILPAVGPAHVGDPSAPRNCMPSMHLTWALLMYTNSRGWMRWPTGAFVGLTALATLATGEHYLPDLIAALPWAWTLNRLAARFA